MAYDTSEASENAGKKRSRPEILLPMAHGKYVFDFASCRSNVVTQATGSIIRDLNTTGMAAFGAQILTFRKHANADGGKGEYFCRFIRRRHERAALRWI